MSLQDKGKPGGFSDIVTAFPDCEIANRIDHAIFATFISAPTRLATGKTRFLNAYAL